ncbi:unnamed protein product [Rotaria socialis]|uniref:Uncharacterized protein n=1 Tax=Rotaria socialis TaxID=392032 RepID=A0A817X8M9_9BILA|nr:unnamed protein product [Rotaria socialis]CAF4430498.1 unnamed protein product [Rotaria socialis]CAF4600579.1 unnamed protein product [Rotaria socialis]CAF4938778.1 unnamed protein product [Rotaria socialis]
MIDTKNKKIDAIVLLTLYTMCLIPPPRPRPLRHVLMMFNRQVHGTGDLLEYFIDSLAMTRLIWLSREFLTIINPIQPTNTPKTSKASAMANNIGNPDR